MTETLVIQDLALARGDRPVLRGVSLEVRAGEICALMGASGAGKSTVLRAVAALEAFDAGRITIGDVELRPGRVPKESQLRGLRKRVGFVFQAASLFEQMTALDNVVLAPVHALGWTPERADARARELLASLGVGERIGALPRELSGGEAQRVAIARALAPDPAMLLMDEPTSALDPARRGALGDTLRSLASGDRGMLIATHDVEFARLYADRVVVLEQGRIISDGPPG